MSKKYSLKIPKLSFKMQFPLRKIVFKENIDGGRLFFESPPPP
jgi:hypothetical protein